MTIVAGVVYRYSLLAMEVRAKVCRLLSMVGVVRWTGMPLVWSISVTRALY